MSVNCVMMSPMGSQGLPFILLPDEQIAFNSQTSADFTLKSMEAKSKQSIQAHGTVYLSNKRLVFIAKEGDISSFSLLLHKCRSNAPVTPWFGPNYWKCLFLNNDKDSGLLDYEKYFEVLLTFKNGGMFDYNAIFQKVYTDAINGVDELPEYSP